MKNYTWPMSRCRTCAKTPHEYFFEKDLTQLIESLSRHVSVDSLQAFYQTTDVIVAVPIGPDIVDNLDDRSRLRPGRLGSDRRRFSKIVEQGSVEAVKNYEMGLVGKVLTFTSAAAKHLLEQNARLNRAEKHNELKIRNIDSRGKKIDGHGNRRKLAVAKLANALKRTVGGRAAGDFLNERVALS